MLHDVQQTSSVDLSVIMVDGGFREHFWMVESWLQQTLERQRYEIIWVDYTGSVASEIKQLEGVRCFTLGRDDSEQILAYAYNEGIRQSRGDILVFPDADICCEPTLLETLLDDLSQDTQMVEYVLRLDQREEDYQPNQDLPYLRRTCSLQHTFNYGGCTAVAKKWMIEMNGYEQLPIFNGYHFNGGDNYIRFKNMGLKIRWHPSQRVYHPWHPAPPPKKHLTGDQQTTFIQKRAASSEWKAYNGLDPSQNRQYNKHIMPKTQWSAITTERGTLKISSYGEQEHE